MKQKKLREQANLVAGSAAGWTAHSILGGGFIRLLFVGGLAAIAVAIVKSDDDEKD